MEWKYNGLPLCYETGNWVGKRSDEVLAEDIKGNKHIARVYMGIMDGYYFNWIDSRDYIIDIDIKRWLPIPD